LFLVPKLLLGYVNAPKLCFGKKMKIAEVSPEIIQYAKTGGLAGVAGTLVPHKNS
jgi:hypothetical protein